jgi:dolichol kinase
MKSAQPYQTTSQGYEEGIHWSRRIFHTSNGILALLFYHRDKVLFQKVVGYLLVLLICLECIRLHSSWLNELASRLFYPIMRKNETRRFSGMGYYLAGVLYASCYFDSVVFDLVVIHLAIGDPIAAIFGICFGNPRQGRRDGRMERIWQDFLLVGGYVCGVLYVICIGNKANCAL